MNNLKDMISLLIKKIFSFRFFPLFYSSNHCFDEKTFKAHVKYTWNKIHIHKSHLLKNSVCILNSSYNISFLNTDEQEFKKKKNVKYKFYIKKYIFYIMYSYPKN